jgi:hypothetical protein
MGSLMGTPDAPPVVKVEKGQPRVVARRPPVEAPAPEAQKFYSVEAIRAQKRSEEVVKDKEDPVKKDKDEEKKDKEGVVK